MPYKLIYNRKGNWYPGSRVVTHSFKTKKGAATSKKRLNKKVNDYHIKKSEIVYYRPKKR